LLGELLLNLLAPVDVRLYGSGVWGGDVPRPPAPCECCFQRLLLSAAAPNMLHRQRAGVLARYEFGDKIVGIRKLGRGVLIGFVAVAKPQHSGVRGDRGGYRCALVFGKP
jgi:hypothetical protein